MHLEKNQQNSVESPSSNHTNDSGKFINRRSNDDCRTEPSHSSPRFPKAYQDFSYSILLLNFIVHFFLQYFSLAIYPFPRKRLLSLLYALPKTNDNMLGNTDHAENGFRMFINELAEYKQLSGYGRLAYAKYITYSLHGRRDFIDYLNAHPDICSVDIGRPFIITGLHRTGTTILHRLMGLDPTCRTTTPLDTFPITNFPLVPPIRSEEERMNHPRSKHWKKHTLKAWKTHAPEEYRMTLRNHRFDPFETEEELILYQQYGSFTFQSALLDPLTNSIIPKPTNPPSPSTSYTKWYLDETTQSDAILLVKRYLQAFHQAWAPKSHWCLKAPQYSLFPTALYANFPKARYIIAHRDPVVAVSSGARLFAESLTAYVESETLDLHGVGKNVLDQSALKFERLNRFRQQIREQDSDLEKSQFLDINFTDIVGDPIGTLKKIYVHFDMPFTPEHEAAVIEYLAQDKVRRKEEREGGGKKLRRPLDLPDFGLTAEVVRERFPSEEFCDGRVEVIVHS